MPTRSLPDNDDATPEASGRSGYSFFARSFRSASAVVTPRTRSGDNDLGRRVEAERQDRRNADDGQDRQSKAVVGAQAAQISQERDAVVHRVAY